jgi:hypothetical protein
MAGAFILAEELSKAGMNVGCALTNYERKLRPAVQKKQAAGRSMAKWFVPASNTRIAIRDTFMRLTTAGFYSGSVRIVRVASSASILANTRMPV